MERIPEPDTSLSLFGFSHATSVLAITFAILAIYVLVDNLRPRANQRRHEQDDETVRWVEPGEEKRAR
jgi:hypothetical protein